MSDQIDNPTPSQKKRSVRSCGRPGAMGSTPRPNEKSKPSSYTYENQNDMMLEILKRLEKAKD